MKKSLLLTLMAAFIGFTIPALAVPHTAPVPTPKEKTEKEVVSAKEDWAKMSKKEKRAKRKEMKKELKSAIKAIKKQDASDVSLTLLVILAILIPPLAMGIYDGISKRFWISLLLTLLFFLPGMIYTLVVILREN